MEKEEYRRFSLRLPKPLYDELEALAKKEHRTVTGQIILAIERMVEEAQQEKK